MKKILYIIVGLISLLSYSNATAVGNLFDVNIKDNQIKIESNVMTYYFANIISIDDKTISSPVLISRNEKWLKVNYGDFDLKWDGYIPVLGYDAPKDYFDMNSKKTDIEYPSNYYSDWKNSKLRFQGANLKLFWDESSKNHKIQATALFLLNLSVIPQLVADSVSSDWEISKFTKGKINKYLELTKNLSNIKSYIDDITFWYTMIDISINFGEELTKALMDEDVPIPKALSESLSYWKYTKTLIENVIGGVSTLNIDRKLEVEIREFTQRETEMARSDYYKSISAPLDGGDKMIEAMMKASAKTVSKVKDDEAKVGKVIDVFLSGLQRGLTSYQKNKLAELKKSDKELYLKKANRIRYAKIAVTIAGLTNKIISTNDFKEDGSFILKFLGDVGGEIAGLMADSYINDPMKFINKYSGSVADNYFSKAEQGVAKIGRGFKIGNAIGNKLIPFMIDFIGEDNLVSLDIVDGKLSMYGSLQNRIKLYSTHYNSNDLEDKLIFDGTNLNDEAIYPIYIDSTENNMHELSVEVYAKQEHLFDDTERSPWDIAYSLPPSVLYSVYIGNKKGAYTNFGLCAKRPFGDFFSIVTSFVEYKFDDEDGKVAKDCLSDETFAYPYALGNSGSYQFVNGLDMNEPYMDYLKLKSLDAEIPIVKDIYKFYTENTAEENTQTTYTGDDDILMILKGFQNDSINIHFPLKSLPIIEISASLSDEFDTFKIDGITELTDNEAIKYIWSFSDKEETLETIDPTVKREVTQKNYTAFVTIYTKNGNIIYRKYHLSRPMSPLFDVIGGNTDFNNYSIGETITLNAKSSIGGDKIYWIIQNNDNQEDVYSSEDEEITYQFNSTGNYTITLILEDTLKGEQVTKELDIKVESYNQTPPTAKAGEDQKITLGKSVTLSATQSFDSQTPKNQLIYEWSGASISTSYDENYTIDNLALGEHNITLKVTDESGAVGEDSVLVMVEITKDFITLSATTSDDKKIILTSNKDLQSYSFSNAIYFQHKETNEKIVFPSSSINNIWKFKDCEASSPPNVSTESSITSVKIEDSTPPVTGELGEGSTTFSTSEGGFNPLNDTTSETTCTDYDYKVLEITAPTDKENYKLIVEETIESVSGAILSEQFVYDMGQLTETVDLSNGLVAHYKFDGDANDSSGNRNNGQPTSAVSFNTGKFGQSAIFGGVDNPGHIYIPNSSTLQFQDGATYSTWFKIDALKSMDGYGSTTTSGGAFSILAKSHDRAGGAFMILWNNQMEIAPHIATYDGWTSGEPTRNNMKINSLGEWVHMVVVLSTTQGSNVYLNGKLCYQSSNNVNFSRMNSEALYIGKFSDYWFPLFGGVDDLRIYNRALNEAEVNELYGMGL